MRVRAVEARLAQAIATSARAMAVAATVRGHAAVPWASATFDGARHDMVVAAPRAPRLGEWVAALPDAELAMRGHLVASLAVERIEDDGVEVRVTLSVLTIEDR